MTAILSWINNRTLTRLKRTFNNSKAIWSHFQHSVPPLLLAITLLALPAGSTLITPLTSSSTVPSFTIESVIKDQSVSIKTNNFPANQIFNATMGPMGTKGINGISVGTLDSGIGGIIDASFNIPPELAGNNQISIRLQTEDLYPYYAFNWFYNNTAGTAP